MQNDHNSTHQKRKRFLCKGRTGKGRRFHACHYMKRKREKRSGRQAKVLWWIQELTEGKWTVVRVGPVVAYVLQVWITCCNNRRRSLRGSERFCGNHEREYILGTVFRIGSAWKRETVQRNCGQRSKTRNRVRRQLDGIYKIRSAPVNAIGIMMRDVLLVEGNVA